MADCCNSTPSYPPCHCPAGCDCDHLARLTAAGGMSMVFGPAERLDAAVRRIAPQVSVALVRDQETGLTRVHVTYRSRGPLILGWDGRTYRRWSSDDGYGAILPSDPDDAARRAAEMLGARIPTANPRPLSRVESLNYAVGARGWGG
ncbi:hypothetical protein [Actinomadura decatromicini]|uniref:Uncharacterized protein n=1 Tax=Actinomadura decatromicini TaxID=2604572 RepID=A0A5D3FMY3_9ACTN|nr:hypothetical protein [Actinomadura decatromicini]TYK49569.1 hypothetical protein FXF68_17675 [Actinomadura decatromicini]